MSGKHSFLAVDVSGRASPFPVVPFAPPAPDHLAFMDFILRDIAHGVGVPESMMPTAGEVSRGRRVRKVWSLSSELSALNRGDAARR